MSRPRMRALDRIRGGDRTFGRLRDYDHLLERFRGDDRALTPAVGKALEIGVVVLFLGVLTTALYGGAVPDYRDTVGDEVADRAVVAAAERVENAVPPNARTVRSVHAVDLPRSIRDENYRIGVEDRSLVLDHPSPAVDASTPLALPEHVETVAGEWRSSDDAVVLVTDGGDGLRVELTARADLDGGTARVAPGGDRW